MASSSNTPAVPLNARLTELMTDMMMEKAAKDKQQLGNKNLSPSKQAVDKYDEEDNAIDSKSDDNSDSELETLRKRRLKEMMQQACQKAKENGNVQDVDECDFLKIVTGSNIVLCHFYHQTFERCKILDMHLSRIAAIHPKSKFISFM